jgi:very-short-patch-repair endonuclease
MSPVDTIQQLLARKPGLKAQQIADELGLERSQVIAALHSLQGGEVTQDNAYRWWARTASPQGSGAAPAPRTFLANLCRYYLECLSRESGSGISIPAAATADYVALSELPFARPGHELWVTDRAVKRLVQKVRREQGQLTLYIGYALRLRPLFVRNQEEMRIEPVLLYPVEERIDEPGTPLRAASGIPLFNMEVLKTLPAADSGNVIDEAIQLSEELGLANPEDELPEWDEIVLRLQRCRPDWNWREHLDPSTLSQAAPLSELTAPGIYNRAVLFAGTRSPFTYGLEIELRKLMQLDEAAVRDTALGQWLRGENLDSPPAEDRPILEVLPLNTEQRQAVVQGLSAPLTVVTGPPGTGKSQVVTSLLANQAWLESSVLFSSKNNHAVDVVESRTNELGPYPLLLRLGKEEHHARVAQHLTSGLAESASPDATARYEWLQRAHRQDCDRFAAVQRQIAATMSLRNSVDEAERAAEPARTLFGDQRFAALRSADLEIAARRLRALSSALDAARESAQTAMGRFLGDSRGRRVERVSDIARDMSTDAGRLGIAPPAGEPTLDAWESFRDEFARRLEWAERVRAYGRGLEQLRGARPLEQLARDLTAIAEESAHTSLELWQSWLRLWPTRWTPERRRLLSEYVSLLQMIAGGDGYDEGAGRRVFRRYYSLFPKVAKILPCWAVTSLSARGRLPFEPGFFDLVVIDEASQCDIASALPLLYRARRAVIIGDPLQLKHVSTVAPQQDRLMLAAHGLAEGHAAWAYSVNSLFDLARSWCRYEDIVNLRDHHRSHRDIISFSNRYFYRGALRIATDHERLKRPPAEGEPLGPAVRWREVKGKVVRPPAGGALNGPEAEAVVAEVRRLAVDRGYNGAIGVVTPFRAQANRIRTLVHQDRDLTHRLAALQFVVDTVHGFQGDERDVIFFSPVVSVGANDNMLRFLKTHGNLFNVAITRARSELVVVGDRQAALDSGVSYLASFAEYARALAPREARPATHREDGPEYPPVEHPEQVSEWERTLYRAMHVASLTPVPQYEEAPYILDFALFQGERKLDIEVDGENYHRNWDGELCRRDQIRSRRLADLGWDILRFWVYEVRDDLEGTVRRVKAWMEQA